MNSTQSPSTSARMRTFAVALTQTIPAPASTVYGIFADYRDAHPRILPPSFFVGLTVEQGGYGAGTIIQVVGRFAGRTRVIRGIVTEPEPGHLLVESYPAEGMVTSFRVAPDATGESCQVTISTVMPRKWGPIGWIEERIVRRLLNRVFAEELNLVSEHLVRGDVPASPPRPAPNSGLQGMP